MTKNKDLTELALLLKKARLSSGLSQGDVALELGYTSPQFISNWERAKSSPPLEVLGTLTELYGINSKKLIDALMRDYRSRVEQSLKAAKKAN